VSVDATAALLGDRLEALAAALRNAGVAPERAASLLGAASAAATHAVTLVALLDGPAPPVAPAPPVEEPAAQPLPLAA
jgi:hypothetical protein